MLLNLLLKNFEKILIQANLLAHFLDCGHCEWLTHLRALLEA